MSATSISAMYRFTACNNAHANVPLISTVQGSRTAGKPYKRFIEGRTRRCRRVRWTIWFACAVQTGESSAFRSARVVVQRTPQSDDCYANSPQAPDCRTGSCEAGVAVRRWGNRRKVAGKLWIGM